MQIQPIILAGGEGRRLAPLSTPENPKIFAAPPQQPSLLSHTIARCHGWLPPQLIGSIRHRYALLNHARAVGVMPEAILLEPQPKNTAMAVAVAIAYAQQHATPETLVAILPADHAIDDIASWRHDVSQLAAHCLQQHVLGVMGQRPELFSPEFGYMHAPHHGLARVQQFTEKPQQLAHPLGEYLVNLGQCVGTISAFVHALATYAPALWQQAKHAVAHSAKDYEFLLLHEAAYGACEALPFDNAVLEKTDQLWVQPTACGWSDVGSIAAWEAYSGLPLAASIPAHPRTDRPWGYYELLEAQPHTLRKRLTVYPGCRLSLQRHRARSEHWHVLAGEAEVVCNNQHTRLHAGDEILIPQGAWHRLTNKGPLPLMIEETQTGTPDEADIERADDDYGRI
jgi:mannose-1-phosphate guanylyltransferase/mannose-6-phosphate isomerase-like protein (cupin superfamily)